MGGGSIGGIGVRRRGGLLWLGSGGFEGKCGGACRQKVAHEPFFARKRGYGMRLGNWHGECVCSGCSEVFETFYWR